MASLRGVAFGTEFLEGEGREVMDGENKRGRRVGMEGDGMAKKGRDEEGKGREGKGKKGSDRGKGREVREGKTEGENPIIRKYLHDKRAHLGVFQSAAAGPTSPQLS